MLRFLRWPDDALFSPPHRFEDVLFQVLLLLDAESRVPKQSSLPSPQTPVAGEPISPAPPAPDS